MHLSSVCHSCCFRELSCIFQLDGIKLECLVFLVKVVIFFRTFT